MELYAFQLGATVALEAPIVALLCGREQPLRALAAAASINLLSHPLATLCIGSGIIDWLGAELLVLGFETLALKSALELRPSHAFAIATLANAITAGLALSIR
jgi:hypothetical protein